MSEGVMNSRSGKRIGLVAAGLGVALLAGVAVHGFAGKTGRSAADGATVSSVASVEQALPALLIVEEIDETAPRLVDTPRAVDTLVMPALPSDPPPPETAVVGEPAICGEALFSLAALNQRAVDRDGVFVFLAGNDVDQAHAVAERIENVARTFLEHDVNLGLFTLQTGSAEYANWALQAPPPSVVLLLKGGGVNVVAGEVTEAKLMHALLAATGAGGCGPTCHP